MHTEEQANTLWCPQARSWSVETINGQDSFVVTNEKEHCIASKCAMWRWTITPEQSERGSKPSGTAGPYNYPSMGYCGLAGKPGGAS